tara:strand:- start:219 stop:458 length:240 start_codon:yes stop_codon:yes gene_type:complete
MPIGEIIQVTEATGHQPVKVKMYNYNGVITNNQSTSSASAELDVLYQKYKIIPLDKWSILSRYLDFRFSVDLDELVKSV